MLEGRKEKACERRILAKREYEDGVVGARGTRRDVKSPGGRRNGYEG